MATDTIKNYRYGFSVSITEYLNPRRERVARGRGNEMIGNGRH